MIKQYKSRRSIIHEAWHKRIADELFIDTGTLTTWGRYLDMLNFYPDMFLQVEESTCK